MRIVIRAVRRILVLASILLRKKNDCDREKNSPFECGFDPISEGHIVFSLRFFLIAVIFIIFDVEITLLIPFRRGRRWGDTSIWTILGVFFLFILLLGTYHEWKQGALDWKN